MKTKIGYSIFALSAGLAVGIAFALRQQRKQQVESNLIADKVFNSVISRENPFAKEYKFLEFFDKNNIKEAYSRYEKYMDLGLKEQDAFKAVVEDKRNT